MTRATVSLALLLLLAGSASAQDVFPPERIALTRAFFERNAAASGSEHMDCITTLNAAARLLFDDPFIPVGSQIDHTMNALRGVGLAGPARQIDFNDERGRLTHGVAAPKALRESVWDVAIGMTRGARGWNVFGLSLMDGYHSVTLNVDTSDPANPKIYWSDQWSSNGGFRLHTKESLDGEVTRLTTSWWNPATKHRTRTTLWRLTPTDTSRVLTINAPTLNVRSTPSTTAGVVETARRGQRYRVLSQRGLWYQVARADGSTGWVHRAYVGTARAVAPAPLRPGDLTVSAGLTGGLPN
jgi:hypothetical protein